MMTHLFNSHCRCRLNGVSKWSFACPKNVKQSPSKALQLRVQNTTNIGRYQNNLCPSNLRTTSGFNFWIQIRFQNEWPRFHRDIQLPNFDPYRKKDYKDVTKTKWGSGDDKLGYTYFIAFFGFMCGTYCVKCELIHYVTFMGTPADVIALASIEVELGKIPLGACVAYKWRGKPLFVRHRTVVDIENEAKTPLSELRDPETPEQRTINPEWLVVVGICTHLGCVPIPNSGDWPGGFYCPCHGSHYDSVGRARKGPAPLNLEVPPYKFISDTLVVVG